MPTYNPNEAKELVETLQKQAVAARIYGALFAIVQGPPFPRSRRE